MAIKDFLADADVVIDLGAADKTGLLRELSDRAAARLGVDADAATDLMLKREALGSTGMGGGIAIPHARLAGLKKPFGILARRRRPIDFETIDGKPVDI